MAQQLLQMDWLGHDYAPGMRLTMCFRVQCSSSRAAVLSPSIATFTSFRRISIFFHGTVVTTSEETDSRRIIAISQLENGQGSRRASVLAPISISTMRGR